MLCPFSPQAKEEMKAKEALLRNFFGNVGAALRAARPGATATRWDVSLLCCR